jgi:hypothetical protein
MSPLVEGALKAIESEVPEVVSEGFLTLAEVVAVNRIWNFHSDVIPEANNEILEWAPLEQIQHAIQHWIERNPDHPQAGGAFYVLYNFRDKSLRPFLRHWLARYVRQIEPYLPALGQIVVDLDSLGERVISGNYYSAMEGGKNLDDAIRYLNATALKAPKSPPSE